MLSPGLEVRARFTAGDDIRDAGLTAPEDVQRFHNIIYAEECPAWQSLDVYRPVGAQGELPVIVSVHGGGWVYGDKERYSFYCMDLARRGFAVVNFSYRLAPEYKWPAQFEDTNTVFTWVCTHAGEYGFDLSHVFAVGDSAGGHMLALYCDFCTNADYAARYAFAPPKGFVPKAVALNCGVYHFLADEEGREGLMSELMPDGGTAQELAGICPDAYVTKGFPPCFIMTCSGDFLTGEPKNLIPPLMAAGTPFEFHYYTDASRELGHVFHLDIRSAAAIRCNDEECAYFRTFLEE